MAAWTRAVLVSVAVAGAVVAFAGPVDGETHTTAIEECRTITESGYYELVADLNVSGEGACLHVAANDVTLDGGDHTLGGRGDGTGVRVAPRTVTETVRNVTVRDVAIRDAGTGVAVGGDVSAVEMTGILASNNTAGVVVVDAADVHIEQVVATANARGMDVRNVTRPTVRNVTVRGSERAGVDATSGTAHATFRNVTVRENGGDGMVVGPATNVTVAETIAADNGGAGFETVDTDRLRVRTLAAVNNSASGLSLTTTVDARVDNAVVRANDSPAYATANSRNVSVSFTSLDGVREVAVADGNVVLEAATVPETPRGVGPAGPALTVSAAPSSTLETDPVRLAYRYDDACVTLTPPLWRYDDDWQSLPDSETTDGVVAATVSEPGTVVPLSVTLLSPSTCQPSVATRSASRIGTARSG